jgi:hypothetical protein
MQWALGKIQGEFAACAFYASVRSKRVDGVFRNRRIRTKKQQLLPRQRLTEVVPKITMAGSEHGYQQCSKTQDSPAV